MHYRQIEVLRVLLKHARSPGASVTGYRVDEGMRDDKGHTAAGLAEILHYEDASRLFQAACVPYFFSSFAERNQVCRKYVAILFHRRCLLLVSQTALIVS